MVDHAELSRLETVWRESNNPSDVVIWEMTLRWHIERDHGETGPTEAPMGLHLRLHQNGPE